MTNEEIKDAVLLALCDVAPEADPGTLRTDVDLRDQLDIDSMDSLNWVIGIHERLNVDIPEAEWGRLQTLDEVVGYIEAATAA
jgi:acyl carrier protein